jgi:hypothetical protein
MPRRTDISSILIISAVAAFLLGSEAEAAV